MYIDEGAELAALLKTDYIGVYFADGKETANLGHIKINFQQSANDPAVVVQITGSLPRGIMMFLVI